MYAYPGVPYRRLDRIIEGGFARIDAAVDAVIAKYPMPEQAKNVIEECCEKEARRQELQQLAGLNPFNQIQSAQQRAMQNAYNACYNPYNNCYRGGMMGLLFNHQGEALNTECRIAGYMQGIL